MTQRLKDYIQFPEAITKLEVLEKISKSGCKMEMLVVNDKYKIVPTGNPDKPFKKSKI